MNTVRVSLAPTPGFCIKSLALQPAVCNVTPPPAEVPSSSSPTRLDAPAAATATITIPRGVKVFVNICWDANVPAPPPGSEDVIQRAMRGEEIPDDHAWFVPVVVSEPREVHDKAGKPSVVFDCVYHSSLKSRSIKDPEFKTFLIELAFQRIEAQSGVPLSRQIGTPNIRAKGELHPRTVLIPRALLGKDVAGLEGAQNAAPAWKLVEELEGPPAQNPGKSTEKSVGILKKTISEIASTQSRSISSEAAPLQCPALSWAKDLSEDRLKIMFSVPDITHAHVRNATLDIEPRRIILNAPPLYGADIDLDLPDAQIRDIARWSEATAEQVLTLKRQRDLKVGDARAEWRVAERRLVILA